MHKTVAIAVLALCALAHFPFSAAPGAPSGAAPPPYGSTHIDFTYDDADFVVNNASIRSFDTAWQAAFAAFPPEQPERGLYRPLTNLSYALDYALFGDDARGYHVVNTALYVVVVLAVYALALRWFDDRRLAFAAALVFAVHPVHCDAVDSISGRSELLALGFGVGSWITFDRATQCGEEHRGIGLVSALLYACASLSKETGVLLPAVFALHLLARDGAPAGGRGFARKALDNTSLHLGIACLYLALRLEILGGLGPEAPVLAGIDAATRALAMGAVFAEYLRLLVFPGVLQLDFYYQQWIGIPAQLSARIAFGWASMALLFGAFGLATVATLRGGSRLTAPVRRALIGGLGSFFVFLAPVSHLLDIGALMAERFLFAPSLGFIFGAVGLVGLALERWVPSAALRSGVAALLLASVAVAGVARSAVRAAEWRDGVRLWESAARHTPDDYRSYTNIAKHWIDRRDYDEAEIALRRALELQPGDRAASLNLSVIHLERGELDDAEAIQRALLRADPDDFMAWYTLGNVELRRFEHGKAVEAFERTLSANPNFAAASASIAKANEQIAAAKRFLAETEERARTSSDAELLAAYARACRMTRDYACATEFDERAERAERR